MIASSVFFPPLNKHLDSILRFPVFVDGSFALSVLLVTIYADWKRQAAILDFAPDYVTQHSLLLSIRHAPSDFQSFLHAAALKDCVPYAWSYREMAFYRLPLSAAVNVLPRYWIKMCSFRREDIKH